MKLARYRDRTGTHWGIVETPASVRRINVPFAEWAPALTEVPSKPPLTDAVETPLASVTLLAPVEPSAEIVGTGFNYPGRATPDGVDAHIYLRPNSSIVGTGEMLRFPRLIGVQGQCRFTYGIELVTVMGRPIRDRAHPIRDVLGYTIGNDGSLLHTKPSIVGMDMFGAKSGYATTSVGPWLVTKDELGGAGQVDLAMTTLLNGHIRQQARTGQMLRPIDNLLADIGTRIYLDTGDVVFTGTSSYVGQCDGAYMPGDRVEMEIGHIGILRNSIEDVDYYPSCRRPRSLRLASQESARASPGSVRT